MRFVFIMVLVLSLLLVGCSSKTGDVQEEVTAPVASQPETTPTPEPAEEVIVDVSTVETDIAMDDVDKAIEDINLDDW
jgi:PBP1b-binding outer membrane lipoprotein LpoB